MGTHVDPCRSLPESPPDTFLTSPGRAAKVLLRKGMSELPFLNMREVCVGGGVDSGREREPWLCQWEPG